MRLTASLFRSKYGYIFKLKWKIQSNKKIIDGGVPDALLKKGTKIWDAAEIADPKEELPLVVVPKLLGMGPDKPCGSEHPQWKPRICYTCHDKTRLLEGLEQAQILTKTVVYQGLPSQIQNRINETVSSKRDEILKRIILQSTVSDGSQTLLPKRLDIQRPGHVFPREYGIKRTRTVELFTRNLVRFLDNGISKFDESSNRNVIRNCWASVPILKDSDQIQFSFKADIAIVDRQPLKPFADADEVLQASQSELPDIYPIKHTIDLDQTNIYELNNFFPIRKAAAHSFLHTIYLYQLHPYPKWLPRHIIARALTACYTFAASQARSIHGLDAQEMKNPVAIQCVITDGKQFTLVAFQLNTLNLDGRSGIKNMAWIETGFNLYEVSKEEDGKLTFEGYDPLVIDRLSAMHINGLGLKSRTLLNVDTKSPQ